MIEQVSSIHRDVGSYSRVCMRLLYWTSDPTQRVLDTTLVATPTVDGGEYAVKDLQRGQGLRVYDREKPSFIKTAMRATLVVAVVVFLAVA